jgi:hypothetical protein
MLGVERVGDRRSKAILAQDFSVKIRAQAQNQKTTSPPRRSCGVFLFLLFLPSGAGSQRPGAVKGAPQFRRGGSAPLTARTAAKESGREEKTALSIVESLQMEDNHDG